jgi:hypothetical protein
MKIDLRHVLHCPPQPTTIAGVAIPAAQRAVQLAQHCGLLPRPFTSSGTEGLLTLRWREMDSNCRSPAAVKLAETLSPEGSSRI